MRTVLPTLLDHDPGMLAIIARRWDVDLSMNDKREKAEALAQAMLEPDRAAHEWSRLSDRERGALQTLLTTADHKMSEAQFSRVFGEIRQMGPGRRDREKPHLNPVSSAETLYYRGLIALAYDQGKTGVQAFVYVPSDLAAILPVHETGFDLSEEPVSDNAPVIDDAFEPDDMQLANTTLVDDLTTLLAYLRLHNLSSERSQLFEAVQTGLAEHWLTPRPPAAIALLIDLVSGLGAATDDNGQFKLVPNPARQWLELTRPRQARALAETWRDSTLFNDLWHTPGLRMEDTGWRNDPLLARQTVLTFLELVPAQQWWPVNDLIEQVYTEEPDFQRPGGDYDSWYIRDATSGEYVRGFASWEIVDGAVLRFILAGPMHWLGLVDLGHTGENTVCRLTIYGRALAGETEWPDLQEDRPNVTIENDGTIRAPRTLSRYERFQLARITEWGAAGDPYVYRVTTAGLQQAAEQEIGADAIRAFLRRVSGDGVPQSIQQIIERWGSVGGAEAWLTRAVILRTDTPEALQTILDTPELRRYLGARLGPAAVIVRAGQENDLASALHNHGILVDFDD
ncbi:MAG: helicase-associated domain-containing protein [Anaerolineae bacterium]|nr:helicase-associated domain-containing protein [Anaerolineae bacterium]